MIDVQGWNQEFQCQLTFCLKLFFQHEKALHALANALLEHETLNAEEIKRILLPFREGRLPEQQEEQEEEADLVLVQNLAPFLVCSLLDTGRGSVQLI